MWVKLSVSQDGQGGAERSVGSVRVEGTKILALQKGRKTCSE